MEMSNEIGGAQASRMSYSGLLPVSGAQLFLIWLQKRADWLIPGKAPGQSGSRASNRAMGFLCLCPSSLLCFLPSKLLGFGHLLSQVGLSTWWPPAALGIYLSHSSWECLIGMVQILTFPTVAGRWGAWPGHMCILGAQERGASNLNNVDWEWEAGGSSKTNQFCYDRAKVSNVHLGLVNNQPLGRWVIIHTENLWAAGPSYWPGTECPLKFWRWILFFLCF